MMYEVVSFINLSSKKLLFVAPSKVLIIQGSFTQPLGWFYAIFSHCIAARKRPLSFCVIYYVKIPSLSILTLENQKRRHFPGGASQSARAASIVRGASSCVLISFVFGECMQRMLYVVKNVFECQNPSVSLSCLHKT